ncbi:unnamed protein product, partial [Ectocarpus sp. 8 AP-2014]
PSISSDRCSCNVRFTSFFFGDFDGNGVQEAVITSTPRSDWRNPAICLRFVDGCTITREDVPSAEPPRLQRNEAETRNDHCYKTLPWPGNGNDRLACDDLRVADKRRLTSCFRSKRGESEILFCVFGCFLYLYPRSMPGRR